ncbi:uncharacterized protein VTP21DRAFT_4595 [Calcarisporiella thermophila]|uniref:uncharacterized protein n=1 Tax=Calcarisporiella thermophila TaxID=911321 RepID=UPI0037421FA2
MTDDTTQLNVPSFLNAIYDEVLRDDVKNFITQRADALPLFERVIAYFQSRTEVNGIALSKKRKLENQDEGKNGGDTILSEQALCTLQDMSVQSPFRKKANIVITSTRIEVQVSSGEKIEWRMDKAALEQGICVPTPDKQAAHWTMCLFNRAGDDSLVFGFGNNVKISCSDPLFNQIGETSPMEHVCRAVQHFANLSIGLPDPSVFSAQKRLRDGTPASYVQTYFRARDGYLFFLPQGLFFGFRKPVLLIRPEDIASKSYHGVTARTFNLTIQLHEDRRALGSPTGSDIQLEFEMIEQAEFENVDRYLTKHEDASLSEKLRQVDVRDMNKGKGKAVATGKGKGRAENQDEMAGMQSVHSYSMEDDDDDVNDEDFVPDEEDEDIPEEYDSDVESENEDRKSNGDSGEEDEKESEAGGEIGETLGGVVEGEGGGESEVDEDEEEEDELAMDEE